MLYSVFRRTVSLLLTGALFFALLPVVEQPISATTSVLQAQNDAAAQTEAQHEVEVWRRTDIILQSEATYKNPYLDVALSVIFTHEDGTTIQLFGFWNGDQEWRIRFAPTKTGIWTYTTTCSNTSDGGLQQRTGTIVATANTHSTALDQHGFVKISDSGRYFTYDDGTPFYWLGDTNWQAPNYVSLTQCNYPGCTCGNQFLHELNNRLDKGFTVYQTYFDAAESDGGDQLATTTEPSLWNNKYTQINPQTFTEKIDRMFDLLADSGMVIALGFGVHSNTTNAMSEEALVALSQYLTARYGSYPVVWITGQEITNSTDSYNKWKKSAEAVDAYDGYRHPQGAHMYPQEMSNDYSKDLDSTSWHEWWTLQGGHTGIPSKTTYQGYWDNGTETGNIKPLLETEANYEDVTCGGFNGYDNSRISAWKANLCGSYGFTYGVTGIWANNYSTAGNTGWFPSYSYEPWYMGLDKAGSYEMTYLRQFFEYADFSTLLPRFNDPAYSDFTIESQNVASSADAATYVAYFYNTGRTTGTLRGLDPAQTYSARWYNPLTGKFVTIAEEITVTNGEYMIPSKPTSGDWALLVTSRDLGNFETESPYTDALVDTRENLAQGATATASSDNGANYVAGMATDGSTGTYWCASGGNMPQWLQVDLGQTTAFEEVDIYMHRGNETRTQYLSYTLEGSNDASQWETLYTAQKAVPTVVRGLDQLRIYTFGRYRYLRIRFAEIVTNWATIYEFEVYADPLGQGEPSTEPARSNLALSATVTAGTMSHVDSSPAQAADGSYSTYWCASSGSVPQWIQFDLGEQMALATADLYLVAGTSSISYTLEGSNDTAQWTILSSGTDATTSSKNGCSYLSLPITGSYRYLKLTFTGIQGNWCTLSELELFAEAQIIPEDDLPEYAGQKQIPVIKSTGSAVYTADGTFSDSSQYLFDGDVNTEWVPFSPFSTQLIDLDLLQQNTLHGIQITLGDGAYLPAFRIFGSQNGISWTILVDTTLRNAQTYYANGGRTMVSEALSGEYRYLRLHWMNGTDNNTSKSIADIQLYADLATPIHPELPDLSQLENAYFSWKNQNNSTQSYATRNWEFLQNQLIAASRILQNPSPASQEQVDQTTQMLNAAIQGLTVTYADYQAYNTAVAAAKAALEESDTYAADSLETLRIVLETNSLDPFLEESQQQTVDLATEAILDALNNLQEKPSFLAGDMNEDGSLSVTDVVLLRKTILNNTFHPAGDMNQDNNLSVTDVVLLRKAILTQ